MPKPPDSTDQILHDILSTDRLILKTVNDSLDVQKEQLKVAEGQLKVSQRTQHLVSAGVTVQRHQLHVSKLILKTLRDILEVTKPHTYRLIVTKEQPNMSVQPGIGAGFKVIMQDNGNPIDPPVGTVYEWMTDDNTDTIEDLSIAQDASLVKITTTDPPTEGRTQLTATASATDPAGEVISCELTTDIVPGVSHTYTLEVQQTFQGGEPIVNPFARRSAPPAPPSRPKGKK
jgi:hypothetical protein